jgi:hypothetical protein
MQPLAQQQLKRRGGHTSVVVVAGERARDRERERERAERGMSGRCGRTEIFFFPILILLSQFYKRILNQIVLEVL